MVSNKEAIMRWFMFMLFILFVWLQVPAHAQFQLEAGAMWHGSSEGQGKFSPVFSFEPDFDLPFDFGLSWSDFVDSTHETVVYAKIGARTWHRKNGRSITLNAYVGTDTQQEQHLRTALEVVYDANKVEGVDLWARVNRDRTKGDEYYSVQAGVIVSFEELFTKK
jgi:hypothetical protein